MLLTTQNAKTSKGEDLGYLTGILYMAPVIGVGFRLAMKLINVINV